MLGPTSHSVLDLLPEHGKVRGKDGGSDKEILGARTVCGVGWGGVGVNLGVRGQVGDGSSGDGSGSGSGSVRVLNGVQAKDGSTRRLFGGACLDLVNKH